MGKSFDYSEFEELTKNFENFNQRYAKFIEDFLIKMALKTLAETKLLSEGEYSTGELREHWQISSVNRVGSDLIVEIFNDLEYASYVEEGHHQKPRFVPGSFLGGKFEYIPGYPFGMVLSDKWIPGKHMARIPITKVNFELPAKYEKALKQFIKELGVE